MNIVIHIPAGFILANAQMSWDDVHFGLEKGFIDPGDVVAIAIDHVSQNDESNATEIELAGLMRDELYRAPDLLGLLTANQNPGIDTKRKWLYLLLSWLYEQRVSFDDPLGLIEQIYADFDYPEDISGFVRYMPPSDGYEPQGYSPAENHQRLLGLWQEFLLKNRAV